MSGDSSRFVTNVVVIYYIDGVKRMVGSDVMVDVWTRDQYNLRISIICDNVCRPGRRSPGFRCVSRPFKGVTETRW